MVTRRELHDLVWSKPMTKVADGFGVSGSYMARVCLTLHVPCPPRGYWAKLAAGKVPAPTPLPGARPGDPEVWTKDERLLPQGMRKPSILRRKDVLRSGDRPDQHPLLLGARETLPELPVGERRGIPQAVQDEAAGHHGEQIGTGSGTWFRKSAFSCPRQGGFSVAFAANHEPLQRATIEKREVPLGRKEQPGHEYPTRWSPYQITRTYCGNTAIGLAIIEMMEEHEFRYVGGRYGREDMFPQSRSRNLTRDRWISRREVPSGRLRLVAYSPYPNTEYSREWQETRKKSLSTRISSIIRDIRLMVPEVEARRVEAIRQAEIWQRELEIRMDSGAGKRTARNPSSR